jgi:hypothetical protein
MSKQIHVGCGPVTGEIFAGTLLKDGRTWSANKQDVTIEALVAVAEHAVRFGKPVEISKANGQLEYRIVTAHTPALLLSASGCAKASAAVGGRSAVSTTSA